VCLATSARMHLGETETIRCIGGRTFLIIILVCVVCSQSRVDSLMRQPIQLMRSRLSDREDLSFADTQPLFLTVRELDGKS